MTQPDTLQTLADARQSGQLRPVDRSRIRAQFALLDRIQPADIRRALALVLARVSDYYQVIAYTGPAYVYGRVDSEYPSALYAKPVENYMYGNWMYQEMSPTHPSCTIERLVNEAGSMCLQTACKVAEAELTEDVPEAQELFRVAGRALMAMVHDRQLSEVRWSDSMRRLGTPGIRKMLKKLSAKLPDTHIGWGGGFFAAVVPAASAWQMGQCRNVTEWSYGREPVAIAC